MDVVAGMRGPFRGGKGSGGGGFGGGAPDLKSRQVDSIQKIL